MNSNAKDRATYKLFLLSFVTIGCFVVLTSPAFASPGSAICWAVAALYSGPARAVAVLGVATVGIGALLGKVSWGMAIIVGIGVAVVGGAGTIVDTLTNTTLTAC